MSEESKGFAIEVHLDLIDEVMEEYFNRVEFKRKVKVVDSKPSSNGYMFQLEHVEVVKGKRDIYPKVHMVDSPTGVEAALMNEPYKVEYTPPKVEASSIRDSNGRFVRKGK